ncbi:MAG: S8 family peptidase [Chloroflexota bacterium]
MKRRLAATVFALLVLMALVLSLAGPALGKTADRPTEPAARKIVVFQDWIVNQAAQDILLDRTGAVKLKHLPLINAAVVLAGPSNERALQQMPEVLRVDEDALVYIQAKPPKPPPTPPAEALPWGVDRIDADLVWASNTGVGVKVAVLDTGIDLKHLDLSVAGGTNTINPLKSANDDNGHGTHVAGIIAALDNEIGAVGVAPGVSLYAVKVLNRRGSGFTSDIIEGVQWSIANGMQVVNMSFGTASDVQSFHDALIAAYNAGIVLVAATGNSGPADNTVLYPAKYAEVIAVSATDSADTVASFSSRGPQVELAAPGISIFSTYKGNSYATLSGTSMASPHVAGTAALVIASGQSGVRAILQATADDLGDTGWDNLYGYGLVDAQEAATGVQTLP